MKKRITEALEAEAAKRDCRILFAVESGSRAWGFASPDSDYDVRAVYVKPLDWYLGLEESKSDTWEAMLPGALDIAAWDLRKALRQLLKCNCSLLEWVGSTIVYADTGLLSLFAAFAHRAFNPARAAYHYASMFRHAMESCGEDGSISVKKLCYALRANAAVLWILEHETMPPTEFAQALEGVGLADKTRRAIDALLVLKSESEEKDRIVPPSTLGELLVDRYNELPRVKWRTSVESQDDLRNELEVLFRTCVKQWPMVAT